MVVSVAAGTRRSVGNASSAVAFSSPARTLVRKAKRGVEIAEEDDNGEGDDDKSEKDAPRGKMVRRQTRSQSRAASVNANVADDTATVPEVRHKAKNSNTKKGPVRQMAAKKPAADAKDERSDGSADEGIVEKEQENIKTPKTQARRMNADDTETKAMSLEKLKTRGRHEYMNKNAGRADEKERKGTEATNGETAGQGDSEHIEMIDLAAAEDGGADEPAPTPAEGPRLALTVIAGMKRKRSITPIRQPDFTSSPLSDPPTTPTVEDSGASITAEIWEDAMEEASVETPSKPPPAKKQKLSDRVHQDPGAFEHGRVERTTAESKSKKQSEALENGRKILLAQEHGQSKRQIAGVVAQNGPEVHNPQSKGPKPPHEEAMTESAREGGLTWMWFNPDAKPAGEHNVMRS